MSTGKGKDFEKKFRIDFEKTVSNSFCFRIPDQVTGYKFNSTNLCDFICFKAPNLYLCECKSHRGASIPFEKITQYNKLKEKVGIPGVRVGVVLWLIDKEMVLYVPISTITKMKEDGKKSVGVKALEEGYNIKVIPSIKKRIFLDSDYSCLVNLEDGE